MQLALITQNSKHVSNSWPGFLMFRNLSPFGSVTYRSLGNSFPRGYYETRTAATAMEHLLELYRIIRILRKCFKKVCQSVKKMLSLMQSVFESDFACAIPCGPETLQRKVFCNVFAKDLKGTRKTLKGKLQNLGRKGC